MSTPVLPVGVEVMFVPWLKRSTECFLATDLGLQLGHTLIFQSQTAWCLAMGGVRWHDEGHHCPTWSDGCRCDLGVEA